MQNPLIFLYVIMDRKEIQRILLREIDDLIKKNGEDYIFLACPMIGKNSWTLRECREAVEKDINLENGPNLIDDYLNYSREKNK